MQAPPVGKLFLALIVSLGLTGCGGGNVGSVVPAPVQTAPTTLTGNWLLAGSRVPAAYPVISTTLYVQGSMVVGEVSISTRCTGNLLNSSGDSVLPIKGTITNDGSFQASESISGPSGGMLSFSLKGNSPQLATLSMWTGSYTLVDTYASAAGCSVTQSGNFTAAAIAPVIGTYLGAAVDPSAIQEPFGSGAILSLQITQGAATPVTRGGLTTYPIPLTATLTVTNSPCAFTASTTTVPEANNLAGDHFILNFVAPASSGQGLLIAALDDPSAVSFSGDLSNLAGSEGCPGIALYHFTRK